MEAPVEFTTFQLYDSVYNDSEIPIINRQLDRLSLINYTHLAKRKTEYFKIDSKSELALHIFKYYYNYFKIIFNELDFYLKDSNNDEIEEIIKYLDNS